MKIEFDKAILWLVPYLYLVSVAYYWGFWGTFGVDAFNYYPVSDLVKGITSSLGRTIMAVSFIGLIAVFMQQSVIRAIIASGLRKFYILLAFAIIIAMISLICRKINSEHVNPELNKLQLIAGSMVAVVGFFVTIIDRRMPDIGMFNGAIRIVCLLFIILLPGQAYIDGINRALKIKYGRDFDYTISDAIGHEKKIYKYLGKAGEYHILISMDNIKRIIIPVGDLKPLVLEKFFVDDTASVRLFKNNQRQLVLNLK